MSDVWPIRMLSDVDSLPPRVIAFTPFLFDMPELSLA